MCFPEKPYVNLERPADRQRALLDPARFLALYPDGAVIDEFQRTGACLLHPTHCG